MPNYKLPITESLKEAWEDVKGSKKTFWGAYGWLGLIGTLFGSAMLILQFLDAGSFKNFVHLLLIFVSTLMTLGITRIGIYRAKNQPIFAQMVFYPLGEISLMLKIAGLWLLKTAIVFVFAALAVLSFTALKILQGGAFSPWLTIAAALVGIISSLSIFYISVRMSLGWGFILDREVNSWQALVLSFRASKCNFWRLAIFHLLCMLILLISLIPLGIGAIWTIPLLQIAYGVAYCRLAKGQGL